MLSSVEIPNLHVNKGTMLWLCHLVLAETNLVSNSHADSSGTQDYFLMPEKEYSSLGKNKQGGFFQS